MLVTNGAAQPLRTWPGTSTSRPMTGPCSMLPASRSPGSTRLRAARRMDDGTGLCLSGRMAARAVAERDLWQQAVRRGKPARAGWLLPFDFIGERDGIRTHDLLIKSQCLCCAKLQWGGQEPAGLFFGFSQLCRLRVLPEGCPPRRQCRRKISR